MTRHFTPVSYTHLIHFNNDLSIVLYIGDVRVNFGFGERLGEKLHELKQLEPQLAGLDVYKRQI